MGIEAKGGSVVSTEVFPGVRPVKERDLVLSRPSPPDSVVLNSFVENHRTVSPVSLNSEWAVFNTAVVSTPSGDYYVSRGLQRPLCLNGGPDMNVLVVVKKSRDGRLERLPDLDLHIGEGDGEVINYEDARVENNGNGIILGMTAVVKDGSGFQIHPALAKLTISDRGLEVKEEDIRVFRKVRGKNVVPFSDGNDGIDGKFLFREDEEPHVLKIVQPSLNGDIAYVGEVDFREFSYIYWGKEKFGAVTRKIEMGNGLAILPIHGVREGVEGIDYPANFAELGRPRVKNVYSVGIAVVDQEWRVLAVDPEPLLQKSRYSNIFPEGEELNPEKIVVYCLDFEESRGEVKFLVNCGDLVNIFDPIPKRYLFRRAWGLLSQ